jgi:hypothetical protein
MKKLLQLCFLIGIVSMGKTFANEGHTQKDINKTKFAEHKVSGHLQSTIQFDGDHLLSFGIINQSNETVKVQLLWDYTSMMSARYTQIGITGKFDLSALPEGTYRIKISSGAEIIEKAFVKTSGATPIFE